MLACDWRVRPIAPRGVTDGEAALLRIALPAAKYWVCKRVVVHAGEALECLGGNGYVEDSGMPRLYREAPLNSIWEGSGNVTALDLLRALGSGHGPVEMLQAELAAATRRRRPAGQCRGEAHRGTGGAA